MYHIFTLVVLLFSGMGYYRRNYGRSARRRTYRRRSYGRKRSYGRPRVRVIRMKLVKRKGSKQLGASALRCYRKNGNSVWCQQKEQNAALAHQQKIANFRAKKEEALATGAMNVTIRNLRNEARQARYRAAATAVAASLFSNPDGTETNPVQF